VGLTTSAHRISTPRRFGKTISVCLFVAALIFACPNVEISIYSTCKQYSLYCMQTYNTRMYRRWRCFLQATDNYLTGKRISQKLLRNCVKFLSIIHDVLNIPHLEFLKQSSDEVELRGGESKYDTRKLNSYPSKVGCISRFFTFLFQQFDGASVHCPFCARVEINQFSGVSCCKSTHSWALNVRASMCISCNLYLTSYISIEKVLANTTNHVAAWICREKKTRHLRCCSRCYCQSCNTSGLSGLLQSNRS